MKVCSQLCKSGLLLTHLGWPTGCMALGQAKSKEIKRPTLQNIGGASQSIQLPHLFLSVGNLHLTSLGTWTSSAHRVSGSVNWRCCYWILTPKLVKWDTRDGSSFFLVAVAIGALVSSPESVKKGGISHVSWLLNLEVGFQAFLQNPVKDLKSYKHRSLPSSRSLFLLSSLAPSLPPFSSLSFSLSPSVSLFLSSLAIKNSDKYYHTPVGTQTQTTDG